MDQSDITPAVKSAVNAYLMARTYAETMREAVDKIQRAVLQEYPMDVAQEWVDKGMEKEGAITEPKHTYLASDVDAKRYFAECNQRTRKAGLKPDSMPDEYCPALVAESLLCDTEQLLARCGAEMMGHDGDEFLHKLLCAGMEKYHTFTDLITGLVVNLPDFKSPVAA